MTVETSKTNHRENGNGHYPAAVNGAVLTTASLTAAGSALEAVCDSVCELARAAPNPPRRIRLQHGQTTVEVEWSDPPASAVAVSAPSAAASAAGPATGAPAGSAAGAADSGQTATDEGRHYVRAPMVGTFYHAGDPETPPFVSVGDVVRPGHPVGILEVMKMMSTIESDVAGRVVEILVPNGQSVEFQQRLIAVDPISAGGPAGPSEPAEPAGE